VGAQAGLDKTLTWEGMVMRINHACVGVVLFALSAAGTRAAMAQSSDEEWEDGGGSTSDPDSGEWHEHESPRIDVHCRAVNDFGYIASASGSLQISSRTQWNALNVSGVLEIDARFIDAPDITRNVTIQGTVDMLGQYLFADVISGADDLASVFFAFGANTMSNVQSKDGIQYQTECSASMLQLPRIADITPTKTLRFIALPDGQLRTQVAVWNVGNAPVMGPVARIRIGGLDVTGTLYDSGATSNTLEPGVSGYVEVDLPAGSVARCGEYPVILDLDHTLQSGAFDPFANDSGQAAAPCLRWNTPITDEALGFPADPLVQYKTLEGIVNSQQIARADGAACSNCHYAGSGKPYSPGAGTITPSQLIGSRAWSGYDGWAYQFYNQPAGVKPEYLRNTFRRWLDDGGL
jgi:hypothetical protein